jgi:hypothetical protein
MGCEQMMVGRAGLLALLEGRGLSGRVAVRGPAGARPAATDVPDVFGANFRTGTVGVSLQSGMRRALAALAVATAAAAAFACAPAAASLTTPQVSAGGLHTCALRSDQTIACWGYNAFGQATPPAGAFTSVSAGGEHTCAVKSDQTIACWGHNAYGQATPPAGTFTSVSAGEYHTCALKSDQTIACWGYNTSGQATPPAGAFTSVSAGGSDTCAVKSDQTIACWGNNGYGQATPPAGAFTSVSAGEYHTCAVKSDQTIACWGNNSSGQTDVPLSVPTPSPPSLSFASQAQSTLSAPQTVTLTYGGLAALNLGNATVGGTNPADFLVTSDNCSRATLAYNQTCTLRVSFAPQAQGARSAQLSIPSNAPASPTTIGLTGTGGSLPQGPPGSTGAAGSTGPAGSQGPTGSTGPAGSAGPAGSQGPTGSTGPAGSAGPAGVNGTKGDTGPAGQIELVTCTTTTKTVKRHKHTQKKCTTKLVTGPVTFSATARASSASLSRGRALYATGTARRNGTKLVLTLLTARRRLTQGRYTLTLSHGRKHQRETITIA